MEIICQKCGTSNDEKSMMCMRCGQILETDATQKYSSIKGNLTSGTLLSVFYILLFTAYLCLLIFLVVPFGNDLLVQLENSFVFEFYNNATLTKIAIETIYTMSMFVLNYIFIAIILEIITHNKMVDLKSVKSFTIITSIYAVISIVVITYLTSGLNYLLLGEHLLSFVAIFPYVKRKMLKRV